MAELSFTDEFKSPVSAARLFEASVVDSTNFYAKLMPEVVLNAAIIEGDGGSGSIKQYNFTKVMPYSYLKERHDVIDKKNFVNKYILCEGGDLGKKLVSYSAYVKFEPTSDGGCVCKVGATYKPVDGVDYTKEMEKDKGDLMGAYKAAEAYLLSNPHAYV